MALIDVRCSSEACGEVREVYRPAAEWPKTPPCELCGSPTEQTHLPKRVQWRVDPVVVFQAQDGSFRFPGDPNGSSAAKYAREGLTRVEIRGAVEMRRFEAHMNRHEFSRAQRAVERKQAVREQMDRENRGELRNRMGQMTRAGRDLARAAMLHNDRKPRDRAHDSGFHSEVYSVDRSNREESRDTQGRRRRD